MRVGSLPYLLLVPPPLLGGALAPHARGGVPGGGVKGPAARKAKKPGAGTGRAPPPPRGPPPPPPTPWGDPDIAGAYNNSDESGIPFERPGSNSPAVDSRTSRRRNSRALDAQRQQQTIERAPGLSEFPGATSPMHWFENYFAANSRAWLVTDPPDGKVPALTDEARQRQRRARRQERDAVRPIRGKTAASTTAASLAAFPAR